MDNPSPNPVVQFIASHLWLLVVLLQLFFFIQIGIIWNLNSQLDEREREIAKAQEEIFIQEKVVTPGMIRGL